MSHASPSAECLSDFALDRLMSGELAGTPEEARARRHLGDCQGCADRQASFAAIELPPRERVIAHVRAQHPTSAPRKRRRLMAVMGSSAALAACVVLGVALSRNTDHSPGQAAAPTLVRAGTDDVRVKGLVTLSGWLRTPSGKLTRLAPGLAVAPGDSLRFEVASAQPGFVAILGLDAAGRATLYVPEAGPLPPLTPGAPVTLPGSIVTDDTLGAERLVALVCPQPVAATSLTSLATAALARAEGDPRRVGPLGAGCEEAALVIEKRAR